MAAHNLVGYDVDGGEWCSCGTKNCALTDGEACPVCIGDGVTMGYGVTHTCERCDGKGVI